MYYKKHILFQKGVDNVEIKKHANFWLSVQQVFFSKFLMGGPQKLLVPVGPRWGRSRMGGELPKKSDWNQKCPP